MGMPPGGAGRGGQQRRRREGGAEGAAAMHVTGTALNVRLFIAPITISICIQEQVAEHGIIPTQIRHIFQLYY